LGKLIGPIGRVRSPEYYNDNIGKLGYNAVMVGVIGNSVKTE